jgi:hypothetical protein
VESIFTEGWLEKAISGSLRNVRHLHGNVSPKWFGDVAKQAAGTIRGTIKAELLREQANDEVIKDLQKRIEELEAKGRTFKGQLDHWRRLAGETAS